MNKYLIRFSCVEKGTKKETYKYLTYSADSVDKTREYAQELMDKYNATSTFNRIKMYEIYIKYEDKEQ